MGSSTELGGEKCQFQLCKLLGMDLPAAEPHPRHLVRKNTGIFSSFTKSMRCWVVEKHNKGAAELREPPWCRSWGRSWLQELPSDRLSRGLETPGHGRCVPSPCPAPPAVPPCPPLSPRCPSLSPRCPSLSPLSPCRSRPGAAAATRGRSDPTPGRSPAGLSRSLSSQGRRKELPQQHSGDQKRIPQFPSVPWGGFPVLSQSCVCDLHAFARRRSPAPHRSPAELGIPLGKLEIGMPGAPPCCWWEVLYPLACLSCRAPRWFPSSWCFELGLLPGRVK